jgi:arginyl-tRNA synthetase
MADPFAIFRRECEALIKSRVPEPAGYVFEIPPRKELGQLACNVAFQLTKLRKNSPRKIAEDIVTGIDRSAFRLVRDVEVAGPGFINFYRDERAYARLVLDAVRADGDAYGRGDGGPVRRPLIEHTSVNPNKAWHIGHARNAVLGDTLARLFRFAGHPVEVQNYIDDTGKQVADMIFGLRYFGRLSDDGMLQVPPGRKLDHFFGEVYAELYEVLSAEPDLVAEAEALAETQREHLSPEQVGERADQAEAALRAVDPRRLPEHEARRLECRRAGWRAVAALHPSSYEARAQEIEDRLAEIAAIRAGAEDIQHALERGDYRELVHACLHAQLATAWRLGIYYDLLTWEQDIVRSHLLEEALTHIKHAPAVRVAEEGPKKGCLVIDMGRLLPQGAAGLDEEDAERSSEVVLVRSNGLPTYVGKDVAYHFWKYGLLQNDMRYAVDTVQPNGQPVWTSTPRGDHRDHFPATEVINVIASHQAYEQQVVATALKIMGHGDIGFHHLAYGMVSARVAGEDVSMSGRRGTGVPADDVLDQAAGFALERVREKQEAALSDEEMRATAERIAAAAMRYVMVRYNPLTDIVLDPAAMVEFEGNTGAYLLYAYTRSAAIVRRAVDRGVAPEAWASYDPTVLAEPAEVDLIDVLGRLPDVIRVTQETLAVNLLAEYGYELATAFSQFYNRCPILNASPPLEAPLLQARLGLVAATAQVMRTLYGILGLELVERL